MIMLLTQIIDDTFAVDCQKKRLPNPDIEVNSKNQVKTSTQSSYRTIFEKVALIYYDVGWIDGLLVSLG